MIVALKVPANLQENFVEVVCEGIKESSRRKVGGAEA